MGFLTSDFRLPGLESFGCLVGQGSTTVSITLVEKDVFGGFGVDVNVVGNMVRVLWERTSEVVCFLSWANMSGL